MKGSCRPRLSAPDIQGSDAATFARASRAAKPYLTTQMISVTIINTIAGKNKIRHVAVFAQSLLHWKHLLDAASRHRAAAGSCRFNAFLSELQQQSGTTFNGVARLTRSPLWSHSSQLLLSLVSLRLISLASVSPTGAATLAGLMSPIRFRTSSASASAVRAA